MVRPKKARSTIPPPASPAAWLPEIAAAYADAREALPFVPLVGGTAGESELFHLGPAVCLKLRGIKSAKSVLRKATDAALTSFVATRDRQPALLSRPELAFAFCYLAAHFGLDLVTDEEVAAVMDFLVDHERELVGLTRRGLR